MRSISRRFATQLRRRSCSPCSPPSRGGALGWGDLLVLAGVASFIVYTVAARDLPGFSPLRYTALTASLGWLSIAGTTAIADAIGAAQLPAGGDVRAALPQLAYITILGAV